MQITRLREENFATICG